MQRTPYIRGVCSRQTVDKIYLIFNIINWCSFLCKNRTPNFTINLWDYEAKTKRSDDTDTRLFANGCAELISAVVMRLVLMQSRMLVFVTVCAKSKPLSLGSAVAQPGEVEGPLFNYKGRDAPTVKPSP